MSVCLEGSDQGFEIAPLLLVVFIENAFKHGVEANEQPSWLKVSTQVEGGQLIFVCENSVNKNSKLKAAGIGLDNVKRRLALQYAGRYDLIINEKSDSYQVVLKLDIAYDQNTDN